MQKSNLNVRVFQNKKSDQPKIWSMNFFLILTVRGPFHRKGLKWKKKKKGGMRLIFEKIEALYAELNERVKAATSGYSATGDFFTMYLFCACG